MTLPEILRSKISSPSGENRLISLREIRKSAIFGGRVMTLPYGKYRCQRSSQLSHPQMAAQETLPCAYSMAFFRL